MKKKVIKGKTTKNKTTKSKPKVKKKTVKAPLERPVKRTVKKDDKLALVLKKSLTPKDLKDIAEQISCVISELGCESIVSIVKQGSASCSYVSDMKRHVASEVLSVGAAIERDRETDSRESHSISLCCDCDAPEEGNNLDWSDCVRESCDCDVCKDKDEVWIDEKEADAILKEKTNG